MRFCSNAGTGSRHKTLIIALRTTFYAQRARNSECCQYRNM